MYVWYTLYADVCIVYRDVYSGIHIHICLGSCACFEGESIRSLPCAFLYF